MSAPEAGKRYHVASKQPLTVRRMHSTPEGCVGVDDAQGHFLWLNFDSLFTWTEVEPEYAIGGLYVDARGLLFRYYDIDTWHLGGSGAFTDRCPLRPLTRLYREGER